MNLFIYYNKKLLQTLTLKEEIIYQFIYKTITLKNILYF